MININYQSISIPKAIITAKAYVDNLTTLDVSYGDSIYHLNTIYFYSQLFRNIGIELNYDSFNWINLSYQEIDALCLYANTFDTIIKDKVIYSPNSLTVKLLP
jgi:hypothetical protein